MLKELDEAGRELAAALDSREAMHCRRSITQVGPQQVRRGDRVLDRQVDANAADGRHDVRGVTDQQKTGSAPMTRSTDFD